MTIQGKRIAFYPCCGSDFNEPVKILKERVDEIIFCDIAPERHSQFLDYKARVNLPSGVDVKFMSCSAEAALETLTQIDILFYRCDSCGEGGSGVCVFTGDYFINLVRKMPKDSGVIITDGSNCWKNTFEKMIRPQGTRRYGWRLRPIECEPIMTRRGRLWVLSVKYEGEE